MNRRSLLRAAALAMAAPPLRANAADPDREADDARIEEVRELFRKARIGSLRASSTEHYRASGDLPFPDLRRVARYCETLRVGFLAHFERTGFRPARPRGRLDFVMLADREAFLRVAREVGARSPWGFYSTQRRVFIFAVFREGEDPAGPIAWEPTLRIAGHEATHQIAYASGLLNPEGDVPDCIGEGLAEIAQPGPEWEPTLLRPTHEWILKFATDIRTDRIGIEDQFRHDRANEDEASGTRRDSVYAHAWLLVTTLMSDDALRAKFRAYLQAIAKRTDKDHRIEDARAHLGDLAALDARMKKHLLRLVQNPPLRYKSVRRASRGG